MGPEALVAVRGQELGCRVISHPLQSFSVSFLFFSFLLLTPLLLSVGEFLFLFLWRGGNSRFLRYPLSEGELIIQFCANLFTIRRTSFLALIVSVVILVSLNGRIPECAPPWLFPAGENGTMYVLRTMYDITQAHLS
ncbi:hypothetical protein ACN38_g12417 [Penicillium nordicum]|uniref:Uncharacterized protein n=1 Tax=Penicillium nordicum TaxID=229535 RepID=A0A0M8NX92_9EURO|nr:hypothetical protein ACN38_g12417 [Penicillium nordicum]